MSKKSKSFLEFGIIFLTTALFVILLWKTSGYFYIDNSNYLLFSTLLPSTPSILLPVSGRFNPFVLIWYGFSIALSNHNIAGIFVGQYLLLGLSFIAVFYLMKKINLALPLRFLFFFLLYVQTTLPENIFTIGKPDPILTAFFLFFVVLLYHYFQENHHTKRNAFLLFVVMFLALITKETAVTFIVPLCIINVMPFFVKTEPSQRKKAGLLLGLFALAYFIFSFLSITLAIESSTAYTEYAITLRLISNNLRYYLQYNLLTCILGLISLLFITWYSIKAIKEKNMPLPLRLSVCISLWGWAYFCGLLLWRWPQGYYLLPCSSLFITSIFLALPNLSLPKLKKPLLAGLLLIGIFSTPISYYVATSQIDVSTSYTDSMNYLKDNLESEHVFIENWIFYEEQLQKTQVLINQVFEKKNSIYSLGPEYYSGEINQDQMTLFGKTEEDFVTTNPQLGDYVVMYTNVRNVGIFVRAVSPAAPIPMTEPRLLTLGYELELVDSQEIHRPIYLFSFPQILRKVDTESSYKIYRVTKVGRDPSLFKTKGHDLDLWTKKTVTIENFENKTLILHLNPASFMAHTANALQLSVNNQFVANIPFDSTMETLDLSPYLKNIDNPKEIALVINKTFVPAEINSNSDDRRELGINCTIEVDF